ncbi:hypothetical protein FKW77_006428 [Venturia effusa]|uniref:MYND-type domain-containing protein n=1 Tax=Venturia effusa TaxID=50376 RepID=A0A517LP95_9PEZI|nr:hypothetical protein FKW77_006428 [Venturia effusa]
MPDCAICSKQSTLTCDNCRKIHYCSEDCLEADAHLHNIICEAVADFTAPRPSSDHYIAFFFPDPPARSRDDDDKDEDEDDEMSDAAVPKLVWIKSTYNEDEDYLESDEDEIEAVMGINPGDGVKKVTQHIDDDNEKFIRIWRHKLAALVGLEYNSIINGIDEDCYWRGPVLVQTGIAGELLEPLEIRDMEATDMKDIVIFCGEFGRDLG